MSSTDTNQASEDNLRKNIELIILTWSSEISGQPREKLHPEADQFVLRLIDLVRTEKLKLLAEVREQKKTYVTEVRWKNATTEEAIPLDALTKLEAGL